MSTARFNGHHMTAIVSAVCVAIVLAPVAVWASSAPRSTSSQKVYITDPHNQADKASVSSTGALSVGGDVKVLNLPAVQSVSGTVNVGNLPATQSVSGTVNVGNLPATQSVSGTITSAPGRPTTPFASYDPEPGTSGHAQAEAASGTLVAQDVSVQVTVLSGNQPSGELAWSSNGSTGLVFIPLTLAYSSGGDNYYVGNQAVQLYVDPGTALRFYPSSTGGASTIAFMGLGVSGYSVG
jgi:hypothetical protein